MLAGVGSLLTFQLSVLRDASISGFGSARGDIGDMKGLVVAV